MSRDSCLEITVGFAVPLEALLARIHPRGAPHPRRIRQTVSTSRDSSPSLPSDKALRDSTGEPPICSKGFSPTLPAPNT